MIDAITIARITDTAQIVDVVSDFVTLRKRGVNFVGLCPFHDDRTPSFYVSPAKNICKCFACGEGGTPINFVMKHEKVSYTDALKYLAKKYNIEVHEKELTDEEKQAANDRESMFILNEFARDYFVKTLHNNPEGKAIGLSYFRERGFHESTIKKFELGYSLDERNAFSTEAERQGYKRDYLVKTGLAFGDNPNAPLTDRFRGRVMFPVHTLSGKVVAFGGRILKKAENTGKYVNSPESEIYSKSKELYGIFFARNAIVKKDRCFLVEGYTDVISMHQSGIENVVSSSGTALTLGQIRMIRRFTPNITVIYDGDAAGIKAALRGIDLLLEEGMNVKVVLLPDGEDPDSFAKSQSAESFTSYIDQHEVDFIRFKTQLLMDDVGNDPIKRSELISNIVHSISLIPDMIKRSVYIKECALLMGVKENVLINATNKLKITQYDKHKTEEKKAVEHKKLDAFLAQEGKAPNPLQPFEYAIMRYIVRYGNHPLLSVNNEGEKMALDEDQSFLREGIVEYVDRELSTDQISFSTPLFAQMFEVALAHLNNDDDDLSKVFLTHPNPNISEVATEMVSDKYHLSNIHYKQLGEKVGNESSRLHEYNSLFTLVPRAVLELKNKIIDQRIKYIMAALKSTTDEGETFTLTRELMDMRELRKQIATMLGERIIIKF